MNDPLYDKLVEQVRRHLIFWGMSRRRVRSAIRKHPYFQDWLDHDPIRAKATARQRNEFVEEIINLALHGN
jgi:hypothetical protein